MTNLSPAAQAVLDAATLRHGCVPADISASALRVASNDWRIDTEFIGGVEYIRTSTLDDIANELEGK